MTSVSNCTVCIHLQQPIQWIEQSALKEARGQCCHSLPWLDDRVCHYSLILSQTHLLGYHFQNKRNQLFLYTMKALPSKNSIEDFLVNRIWALFFHVRAKLLCHSIQLTLPGQFKWFSALLSHYICLLYLQDFRQWYLPAFGLLQ